MNDREILMTQAQGASTVDKVTQAQQGDSDSPKGLPLPNPHSTN